MFDNFPVAVKQLSSITNILDWMKKGPATGPLSVRSIMSKNINFLHIIQIGAGGTGGYVAAEILRILGGLPIPIQRYVYYTLMDGDEFEEKNLGRQLCTEDDIGVNKAVSIIENYADYYNVLSGHAIALPKYLTSIEDLMELKHGLVDSHIPIRIVYNKDNNDKELAYVMNIDEVIEQKLQPKELIETLVQEKAKGAVGIVFDVESKYKNTTKGVCVETRQAFEEDKAMDDSIVTIPVSFANNITTIIIDCVDKTTPRKIIHEYLERQYSYPSLLEVCQNLSDRRTEFTTMEGVQNGANSFKERRGYFDHGIRFLNFGMSENYHSVVLSRDGFGSEYNASKGELFPNNPSTRFESNGTVDTYIISSGNGKYTGQVYWGRYSSISAGTRPIRYEDIETTGLDISTLLPKMNIDSVRKSDYMKYDISSFSEVMSGEYRKSHLTDTYVYSMFDDNRTNDKMLFNILYKAYAMDCKHSITDPEISKPYRSLFELPYEWDELNGKIKVDESSINIESFDAYASSIISVPSPYLRNPDLIDESKDIEEEQMSCAERAATNVQNIAANKTAANLVVNYFRSILNGMFPLEKDAYNMLSTVGVSFDVRSNLYKPEMLTKTYLKNYDSFKLWKDSGREYFVEESNTELNGGK